MGAASRLVSVLPAAEARRLLAEVPAAYHSRINDVLLTALALAVARWRELRGEAAGGGVLLELEGHGRSEALFAGVDLSRTVGWFTSLYPVRLEPGLDAAGVAEALVGGAAAGLALKRVKEQLRAVPREGIGFGLLRHLAPEAAAMLAGLPRPALLFNYLGQFDRLLPGGAEAAGWALAGEAAGAAVADARGRGHRLEANAVVAGGMLQVEWRWCGAVHEAASVAGLAEQFLAGLRGLIAHCLTPGVGGHTPSDFPLAGVDQATLEAIERQHPELEDLYPLTPLQEGLLFHGLYDRAGDPYHIQLTLDLAGEVEGAALRAAWQLIARPARRLADGRAARAVRPAAAAGARQRRPALDRARLVQPRRGSVPLRLENLLADDRAQGFDFTAGPLLRVALLHRADRRWTLVTSYHHLILDGWSQGRVIGELLQAYAVLRQGGTPELPPVPPPSAYAAWLAKQDHGHWRGLLASLPGRPRRPLPHGGAGPRHRHARARPAWASTR